jgi:hypothetical protein
VVFSLGDLGFLGGFRAVARRCLGALALPAAGFNARFVFFLAIS